MLLLLVWLVLFVAYFSRNPRRYSPNNDGVFVSPANGTIVSIHTWDEDDDSDILVEKNNHFAFNTSIQDVAKKWYLINIKMTINNVHYQNAMINSVLLEQKYFPGKHMNALKKKNAMKITWENEHNEMLFETPYGIRYKVIQVAGKLARKIKSYVKVWQDVTQWQKIWFITLGSQVTILLPYDNVEILTHIGHKVRNGESIIAIVKN